MVRISLHLIAYIPYLKQDASPVFHRLVQLAGNSTASLRISSLQDSISPKKTVFFLRKQLPRICSCAIPIWTRKQLHRWWLTQYLISLSHLIFSQTNLLHIASPDKTKDSTRHTDLNARIEWNQVDLTANLNLHMTSLKPCSFILLHRRSSWVWVFLFLSRY